LWLAFVQGAKGPYEAIKEKANLPDKETAKKVWLAALSIKQPWANMIISGEKTIETRTWSTDFRGDLLIVSSKTPAIAPAGYALGGPDQLTAGLLMQTKAL
jgi:hypothetical protein